jgi:hypothetical protein
MGDIERSDRLHIHVAHRRALKPKHIFQPEAKLSDHFASELAQAAMKFTL